MPKAQVDQFRADVKGARAEHEAFLERERSVEGRAHLQIDSVRQGMKTLQHRLEREQQDHAKGVARWTTMQEALRAAAHQSGHVVALEVPSHPWRPSVPATNLVKRKGAAAKKSHEAEKTPS